jgi:arabinan endo-1,5-alpha-L-arabinosidase
LTLRPIPIGLLFAALAMAQGGEAPGPLSQPPALFAPTVHDPSTIVRCKNEYWLFATGPGVRSLRSTNLLHWQAGPAVFRRPPAWTREVTPDQRGDFWAPDLIRVAGRYLLYYSVSSWGKNTSAIGLATNPTLDPADPAFAWKDEGAVIRSGAGDDFNAIDPSVLWDAEGRLWLSFGSFWSGIKLVELDPATGQRLSPESPLHALAHHKAIEAPFIHRRGGHYYLFVNWGLCCRGTNSTYEIRVGRSLNVIGPYVDREGVDLLRGGGSLLLGSRGAFVGPGHAGILSDAGRDWFSCHFYDGARRGHPALAVRALRWRDDGWPEVQGPAVSDAQR